MEITSLFAEHATGDFTLQEHGETFVQPEMLIIGIGHQITRPTVADLVRNNGCQRFITGLE